MIPAHFARINDRDGFFLLGRSASFDWPDLLGKRLILFAEAPTPWYVLRALMIGRGLDPDRITARGDLPSDQAAAAFRAGEADFLEAPAHIAEELVRDGAAVILREMAHEAGPLPYSSYCARPDVIEREPEVIAALARAHVEALRWMASVSGATIWETIRPSFPDGDPAVYRRAVERYRRLGTWSADATLPREAFDRLAVALQRGGLIARIAPYELVCRDEITRGMLGASTEA
jgi:ABC-type nitrate/sulfonate/bicarbonate transport system substrate-binding protein